MYCRLLLLIKGDGKSVFRIIWKFHREFVWKGMIIVSFLLRILKIRINDTFSIMKFKFKRRLNINIESNVIRWISRFFLFLGKASARLSTIDISREKGCVVKVSIRRSLVKPGSLQPIVSRVLPTKIDKFIGWLTREDGIERWRLCETEENSSKLIWKLNISIGKLSNDQKSIEFIEKKYLFLYNYKQRVVRQVIFLYLKCYKLIKAFLIMIGIIIRFLQYCIKLS